MTTHIEPVTSVTIDPAGLYFATVGHDSSLRIWCMETKSCTQEMSAHQVHTCTMYMRLRSCNGNVIYVAMVMLCMLLW